MIANESVSISKLTLNEAVEYYLIENHVVLLMEKA